VILRFHETLPRIWRLTKFAITLSVLLVLVAPWFDYQTIILICMGFTSSVGLLGLGSGFYLSMQGSRTATMLLTGWFVLLLAIIFMSLSKAGIVYNEFIAEYGLR